VFTVYGSGAQHRFMSPVHGFIKPKPWADRLMTQI
jgi:hypothetical protein